MAKRKRGGPNKSAAIREYLHDHPNAKPKEITEVLNAKGIKVNTGFVSTIKTKHNAKKSGGAKVKRGAAARNGHADVSIDDLLLAKQFATKIGGVERAKKAFDALAKLL